MNNIGELIPIFGMLTGIVIPLGSFFTGFTVKVKTRMKQ
jgi:hypothetical protein